MRLLAISALLTLWSSTAQAWLHPGSGGAALPASQTVNFGEKTRVGAGGSLVSYTGGGTLSITSGNSSDCWQIDNRNMLVPKNGANAYDTAPSSSCASGGPYALVITDGTYSSNVTVNMIANAATVREMTTTPSGVNQDSGQAAQLPVVLNLGIGVAGALVLGDTVIGRDGYWNPSQADVRIKPPSTLWAAGSGPAITITSENQYTATRNADGNLTQGGGFQIGRVSFDGNQVGENDAKVNLVWKYLNFYSDNATSTSLLYYAFGSGKGWGMESRNNSFILGPDVTNVNAVGAIAISNGGVADQNYIENVSAAISYADNAGDPSRAVVITSNVAKSLQSDMIHGTAVNMTVTDNFAFDFRPPVGAHPDGFQQTPGFTDNAVHTNFGTVARNIFLRNSGSSSFEDAQGIFLAGSTGTSSTEDLTLYNNITNLTFLRAVSLTRFTNPDTHANTAVEDFLAPNTDRLGSAFIWDSGTGGSADHNVSNAFTFGAQGGTVTQDNVTLSADATAYAGCFASYPTTYPTTRTTRALAIASFAAKLNGSCKKADGTYYGALFPADNFGTISWNDLSVFDPTQHHTAAQ